jgi:hypothetical protein
VGLPDDASELPVFQLSARTTAAPGTELWMCKVDRMENDQWAMVNRVESVQNAGMHHMDIMALAFANVVLEPGIYDCDEIYERHPELMERGLILYGAQQPDQVVQLPEGVAAALPPNLLVMHELHFINVGDEPVEVFSEVEIHAMDAREVTATIWGDVVRDVEIEIPPQSEQVEWTRCVMDADIDVLFLASHTHQLGREVTIHRFDGVEVGEQVYVSRDWQSPPLQAYTDPPLRIPAGHGFEFACRFSNPTDHTVEWGFTAADEMCQIAYVYTPGDASATCRVVDAGTR